MVLQCFPPPWLPKTTPTKPADLITHVANKIKLCQRGRTATSASLARIVGLKAAPLSSSENPQKLGFLKLVMLRYLRFLSMSSEEKWPNSFCGWLYTAIISSSSGNHFVSQHAVRACHGKLVLCFKAYCKTASAKRKLNGDSLWA